MFLAAGFFAVVVAVDVRCWIAATLAGLMLGAAVAAKPVAAPACVVAWLWAVGCLWRVRDEKRVKRIVIHTIAMVVAAAAPWCVGALYFAAKGAFQEFWSCTFSYNVLYASAHRKGSLAAGLTPMLTKKMNEQGWLWLLAAAGVLVALARPTTRRGGLLAAGWMAAAFLGALLPGQLAYYYYVPTVAALALAGGLALSSAWRGFAAKQARGVIPASILMVVLAAGLVQAVRSQVYSGNSHYKRIQNPEGLNAVVMSVAQYIRDTTEPEDRLYVWGSRAQLYVLSDRLAATPYLYNYSYKLPLGEAYHFQAEKLEAIMAALEEHKPPCIAATETKTLAETGGFTALRKYLDTHYSIEREWEAWDGLEAWEGKPYTVTLFRRRGDAGQ